MDRTYRLSFCQQCIKRGFNPNRGVVCSLTNEHATFDKSCPDYEEDARAKVQADLLREAREKDQLYEETDGFSRIGITNGYIIGSIFLLGGIIWIISGWIGLKSLFIYPFLLIGYGVYKIIRTSVKTAEKKRDLQKKRDLLDGEVKW